MKNIKHYLPHFDLTISNRTYATALDIATANGFSLLPFEDLNDNIKDYDVIVLSTTADKYIVTPENLQNSRTRLILDLSIPQTVHPQCKYNSKLEILDIDSISAILDKSLENRKTYLPIANGILNTHIASFIDWNKFYEQRNQIVVLKNMLIEASNSCPHLARLDSAKKDELVKKTVASFVLDLKQNNGVQLEPEEIVNKFMRHASAN